MQIETTRFGQIEADEDQIVNFPEGIPGFEDSRNFIFLPHPSSGEVKSPFRWMQCTSNPAVAFPVISPWQICPDYAPTVPGQALRDLKISDIGLQTLVWTIVSIPRDNPENATVNLLAPVVINKVDRIARQVVLMNEGYGMRTTLKPQTPSVGSDVSRQRSVELRAA